MLCLLGKSLHIVLGLIHNKTIPKYVFFSDSKCLVKKCQYYCASPLSHPPGHHMQQTGQLNGLPPHACIPLCLMLSQALHLAAPEPPLLFSCWLSSVGICGEESRGDFLVCSLLHTTLCICHNVDRCVLDSSSSLQWRTSFSGFPLLPVCVPWWYIISPDMACFQLSSLAYI